MGIKGKKNTPITARINAGLFNQKKGVTEPLLGVGPAGVYGDNQTKDIPSPSKKRGYAKRSPLKQVGVNVLKSNSTGDQIVKGKKITTSVNTDDYDGSGGYASDEDWTKFLATDAGKEYTKKNTKQVETGESEPDTVIPGATTETNEFTPTQTRDKNDAMSPWRVRQQSRSIKKSGKDVRQSKIKAAKLAASGGGRIDEDGNFQETTKLKGKARRKVVRAARKKAKVEENSAELNAFDKNMTARTRQVEMSSDPLGKSGTFDSASRDMELPDASTTYDGQKTIIEDGGIKKPRPKVKAASTLTPAGIKSSGLGDEEIPTLALKTKSPMKKRGYGMKKPLYK